MFEDYYQISFRIIQKDSKKKKAEKENTTWHKKKSKEINKYTLNVCVFNEWKLLNAWAYYPIWYLSKREKIYNYSSGYRLYYALRFLRFKIKFAAFSWGEGAWIQCLGHTLVTLFLVCMY